MLACVITPPQGLLSPTPTICVECVQATICAENATNDGCPAYSSPTSVDSLPTQETPTPENTPTEEITPTEDITVEIIVTEVPLDGTPMEKTASTVEGTQTRTLTATRTSTSTKTETPTKTETASPISSNTPTATKTMLPGNWVYKTQSGSPKYSTNFAHPELACKWSGVAGQVFGPGGTPQSDVVVVITGVVNGVPYDLLGFTGSAVKYGASAFEIEFPEGPVKTTQTLQIQLFDLAGIELTGRIPFDTFAECDKNLVIYNFTLAN